MQAEGIEPEKAQPYRAAAGAEFARFLTQTRRRAGMTQAQFARKLSMSQPVISRLEHGKCPRLDTFVRVMAKLDADPREVMQAIADAYGF